MEYNQRNRVVETISDSVSLVDAATRLGLVVVNKGASQSTLCPFHSDTTPSMIFYDKASADRHFHCFACGAHGDVFTLVQQVQGVDFRGALNWIARSYGFSIESRSKKSQSPTLPSRTRGLLAALEIFSSKTEPARLEAFLTERNLPAAVAKRAELCIATQGVLTKHISDVKRKGGDWRSLCGDLEASGMIKVGFGTAEVGSTNYLDLPFPLKDFFFDDRVTFPIRDERGELVGFAGRKIAKESSPAAKYLYSPGFKKADVLYRFDWVMSNVRAEIDKKEAVELYICEGLLDALRLEQCGFKAVSLLGAVPSAKQTAKIVELSAALPANASFRCNIFLDRDEAGIKGAAKLVRELYADPVDITYVWPTSRQLDVENVSTELRKDPEEIFRFNSEKAAVLSREWRHSPLLPLIALRLGQQPDDLVEDESWANISRSRKLRALFSLKREIPALRGLLSAEGVTAARWLKDITELLESEISKVNRDINGDFFIVDDDARLNLARTLALSGARRGDLSIDIAAWRRIDIAATAFNQAFRSRLRQGSFEPIEPFEAVHVSRGFGKKDPRLKVMPCPEDLVIQQYLLNELLSEQYDKGARQFSRHIPAVRYYRTENRSIATGGGGAESEELLSFAYQIDMEVLEGRRATSGSGVFRHYFDCWSDFIRQLRRRGDEMERVHVLRLDVRRYYDEIRRSVVRDQLRISFEQAFHELGDALDTWAELFRPSSSTSVRYEQVIDWLCDQSFGFRYYRPDNGSIARSPENKGIPQGPVLSAWLGNVVLFPLDEAIRSVLAQFNIEGAPRRAAYARYVDDVFLLADSAEILSVLRAKAEDSVRRLSLELVSKTGPVAPMSPGDFSTFLTQGRAIDGSGLESEPPIFHAGDGEIGWDTQGWNESQEVHRHTALLLLRDRRLYQADTEFAVNQLYTAMRAPALRPKDLCKAAKWIWFHAAKAFGTTIGAEQVIDEFVLKWKVITSDVDWRLLPKECAWDDPAFFALEGLERLFEAAQLSAQEFAGQADLLGPIKCLAQICSRPAFFHAFEKVLSREPGWGSGLERLPKMYWHQVLVLRSCAARLLGESLPAEGDDFDESTQTRIRPLRAALVRPLITSLEVTGSTGPTAAQSGDDADIRNPIRAGVIWLHEAIARVGRMSAPSVDPLIDHRFVKFSGATMYPYEVAGDQFAPLLMLLSGEANSDAAPSEVVARLALETAIAIVRQDSLVQFLAGRQQLMSQAMQAQPLPALPGVETNGILLIRPGEAAVPLTDVIAISTESPGSSGSCIPPEIPISRFGTGGEVKNLRLEWSTHQKLSPALDSWKAAIPQDVCLVRLERPQGDVQPEMFLWVADLYEALVRISAEDNRHFVAAYPYLVSVTSKDGSSHVSLLGMTASQEKLGNQAFLRDGTRGLRPIPIPNEHAHLWRAGVAVSDLMGFGEDVDADARNLSDLEAETSISREFLRYHLQRLRGYFFGKYALIPHKAKPYLPATINRSLEALRDFPLDPDSDVAFTYALATSFETQAMALRLQDEDSGSRPGAAEHFLERTADHTIRRLKKYMVQKLRNRAASASRTGLRRGVQAWLSIHERAAALPPPATADMQYGWALSLASLRISAAMSWIRALAFELVTEKSRGGSMPLSEIASKWALDADSLELCTRGIGADSSLLIEFRSAISGSSPRPWTLFESITPIGWLLLVADMSGLYQEGGQQGPLQGKPKELDEVREGLSTLANRLSSVVPGMALSTRWPYDVVSESVSENWNEQFFESCLSLLSLFDRLRGTTVEFVDKEPWTYDMTRRTFRTAKGELVACPPWMVSKAGYGPVESIRRSDRYVSRWTETVDRDGKVIGISVLAGNVFEILSGDSRGDEVDLFDSGIPGAAGKDRVAAPVEIVQEEAPDLRQSESTATSPEGKSPLRGPANGGVKLTESERRFLNEWQARAEQSWGGRTHKAPNHIRMALFQWQLDDTYRHPLFDLDVPDYIDKCLRSSDDRVRIAAQRSRALERAKTHQSALHMDSAEAGVLAKSVTKNEETLSLWKQSQRLPSWAEHRRRKLLRHVVQTCCKFNVDVLVLPEYSVRPDTIVWLRKLLHELPQCNLSIVAGTYRLYGNKSDLYFSQALSDAFGVGDFDKIIGGLSNNGDGEKSAILTLLVKTSSFSGDYSVSPVNVFTRRKKYPASALGEIFNPATDPLEPLFTLESFIAELERRDANGVRTLPSRKIDIPARTFITHVLHHLPEQHIAELVCSELFLATSPANYRALAGEYAELLRRFGADRSTDPLESVIKDLHQISRHLGLKALVGDSGGREFSETTGDMMRRTVLVVPAMTSRSADYWLFGQNALLAAGLCTVFCNASAQTEIVGGSCFIGHGSWSGESKAITGIQPHNTPYSGWSRGVYYCKPEDPLGRLEQAVVIADIDPTYMNEGKPRPQNLPLPLKLVAHLPVCEVIHRNFIEAEGKGPIKDRQKFVCAVDKLLKATNVLDPASIWDPETAVAGSQTLAEVAEKLAPFFCDPASFKKRLQHWCHHWRELPWSGPAPAVFDWIWIDQTAEEGSEYESIFVPPWSN